MLDDERCASERLIFYSHRLIAAIRSGIVHALTRAVIVKASSGPRYVVGCRAAVDKTKLKPGTRVSLDMTTLTVMRCVRACASSPSCTALHNACLMRTLAAADPRLEYCLARSIRSCTT